MGFDTCEQPVTAEELQLQQTYAPWIEHLPETFTPEQCAIIQKALHLAMEAHQGQKRKSGEPYISHPCAVAKILIDYGMDHETIAASVLHDVVEDTRYTYEEI